ncbi:MAG: preprotein translocase subunit SecA [Rickettsiales bacterium]
MLAKIVTGLFGSSNDRIVKSLAPIVKQINSLEADFEKLSDLELKGKTDEFKQKIATGVTLDTILPEAFAVVREASKRTLGFRHFDVQLIGGMILHKGMISEMKTGEGKTLVATLPIYLNALTGKGVHLVTVNDYLVKRDAEWMGQIYKFLGLTIGTITNDIDEATRQEAYRADITYGTNNEFGFDYLRDNLKYSKEEMVQREFNYAIVDEVDSILIDEARTPLIISGATDDRTDLYAKVDKLIPELSAEHFEVDEKSKSSVLTDAGHEKIEELLRNRGLVASGTSLYDYENMSVMHHVNQALRAHKLFSKDVDYIVKDGKVMIIDEFTGRIMDGRRYSEGLHQALEAKEKVAIQKENQTLASITFQNYFRMYPKLAGMTGTAMTEAAEFSDIYKLEVASIPTNVAVTRVDEHDEIYLSAKEKYDAIVNEIVRVHETGQPILVGTVSIEKSEHISTLLKKKKIKHNVLNARHHEKEAEIISQAGRPFAVTIATNMAGRGTDIKLGGNPELAEGDNDNAAQIEKDKQKVLEVGGLCVLGTERHESRRIDNQLRGRSGRQGDPGFTKFYLSLEDDLMRIFGSEKIQGLLGKLGVQEGEAITHPWISKSLEKAQSKVEARNYETRKTLLRFDDVMSEQRKVIYDQRLYLMTAENLRETVIQAAKEILEELIARHIPHGSYPEQWDLKGLETEILRQYGMHSDIVNFSSKEGIAEDEISSYLKPLVAEFYEQKIQQYGAQMMARAERQVMLVTLDQLWKEHLHNLDHLRTGIGLRAYAQKDPLNEYKIEAFNLFKRLLDDISELSVERLYHLQITQEIKPLETTPASVVETHAKPASHSPEPQVSVKTHVLPEDRDPRDPKTWGKVARNDACPCGSGKKFKQCHGMI